MTEVLLAASLSKIASLYNVRLFEIADEYGSLMQLYNRWHNKPSSIPGSLGRILDSAWKERIIAEIEQDLKQYKINAVLYSDIDYPNLLNEISDKPYVLYVRGNLDTLHNFDWFSCVGTRTMTQYGRRVIDSLIRPLQNYSVGVVSGLALGVDAEIHRIALDHHIPTIAVLGGGLDRFEPVTNHVLAQRIVDAHCLVSEYPPGVRPQKHHFLERNRIIAGLSRATIVIEGNERSGSLVTARYALSYGRDVGTVPGDIFQPSSAGPHLLLIDGAWPVTSYTTILDMLDIVVEETVLPKIDTPLLKILVDGGASIDTLAAQLGITVAQIRQELTQLELANRVSVSSSGEYYLKS
jgi:DNA processing protein